MIKTSISRKSREVKVIKSGLQHYQDFNFYKMKENSSDNIKIFTSLTSTETKESEINMYRCTRLQDDQDFNFNKIKDNFSDKVKITW